MKIRALRIVRKLCVVMGLLLTGVAVLAGGRKLFEHATFSPAQATVLAVTTKCEMSYKANRWNRTEQLVECTDVSRVKAGNPEIAWEVRRIPIVTVAYRTADNRLATVTERLGKLMVDHVRVGEVIPILVSAGQPSEITGLASITFIAFCGASLVIGLMLLGIATLAHRALENPVVEGQTMEPATHHRVVRGNRLSNFAR
jgi:hypothetical protein